MSNHLTVPPEPGIALPDGRVLQKIVAPRCPACGQPFQPNAVLLQVATGLLPPPQGAPPGTPGRMVQTAVHFGCVVEMREDGKEGQPDTLLRAPAAPGEEGLAL